MNLVTRNYGALASYWQRGENGPETAPPRPKAFQPVAEWSAQRRRGFSAAARFGPGYRRPKLTDSLDRLLRL